MLVRVIKNWSDPDLMRQTPGASGNWGGLHFTCDPVGECDAVIVLNHVPEQLSVRCSPSNVWALMQEPYVPGVFEWMVGGHEQFAHVFTHHPAKKSAGEKYIRCHPAVPWHVNKSYDELKSIAVPDKQRSISSITSNLEAFPGHKVRKDFLALVRSSGLPIDLYGKGVSFIEDKWDGLVPYHYSLAIENSSSPDYWTEKIADCFLSWTIPIYYGCTNLEDYFPAESFIRIDINHPQEALATIAAALSSDKWQSRLPALAEARQRVLDRYQFFPQMQKLIEYYYASHPKKNLVLQPYRGQRSLLNKIRGHMSRLTGAM